MNKGNASELCSAMRQYFYTYGCAEEFTSDGGRQFESTEFSDFLIRWKCKQHITSAYNPHSNLLAESGVKSMKRLLRDNMSKGGGLDNDNFAIAIMTYRNTPLRDLGLSPSQIVFNRNMRDTVPLLPGSYKPRPEWQRILNDREKLLAKRHLLSQEKWSQGTRHLPPLKLGQHVIIQNQTGPKAKKWCLSGTVVEIDNNETYIIKMDGSGRLSRRRRPFLRAVKVFDPNFQKPQEQREEEDFPDDESISENNRRSERLKGRGGDRRTQSS